MSQESKRCVLKRHDMVIAQIGRDFFTGLKMWRKETLIFFNTEGFSVFRVSGTVLQKPRA